MQSIFSVYEQAYQDDDYHVLLHNLEYLNSNMSVTSPLRRFVVDALWAGLSEDTLEQAADMALTPGRLIANMAMAAMKRSDLPWAPWENKWSYRVRLEGESTPANDWDIQFRQWGTPMDHSGVYW